MPKIAHKASEKREQTAKQRKGGGKPEGNAEKRRSSIILSETGKQQGKSGAFAAELCHAAPAKSG